MSPANIESKKLPITFFPNSGFPSLQAIDHFTKLFDITANNTVLAATAKVIFQRPESTAIVWVIASTSASPEIIPSAE